MQHASKHRIALAALLSLMAASAWATPCDQVMGKIDAKIKANGVKSYTLEAIPVADVKDQKVVGTCDVGAKKIVYQRTLASAPPPEGAAVAQNTTATPVTTPAPLPATTPTTDASK